MSKHSKGDWLIEYGTITACYGAKTVCDVNFNGSVEEQNANLRLIVAAPDLLAACKAVVFILKRDTAWANELREQPWYVRMKATVDKIEGIE